MFGNLARRRLFHKDIKKTDVKFITGMGHGEPDRFNGRNRRWLWKGGRIKSQEVSEKVIHLCSCNTGAELGVEIVRRGAKAFFGYDDDFRFFVDKDFTGPRKDNPFSDPFFYVDSKIDKLLIDGETAQVVHNKVIQLYEDLINYWTGKNQEVASRLNHNKKHFCSPGVHRKWGDPDATV